MHGNHARIVLLFMWVFIQEEKRKVTEQVEGLWRERISFSPKSYSAGRWRSDCVLLPAVSYNVFKDAIHQASYTADFTRDGQEMQQTYETTNYYLLGYKTPPDGVSIIGGKTGTTDNAGLCLILYVEDASGNGYISVLLGCPDKDTLYSSMSKLLSKIRK